MAQANLGRKPHAVALSVLLALFCFRVLAQWLQLNFDLPFLPAFEAWHSGALPYPTLLVLQIAIIAIYGWMLWRIGAGRVQPTRNAGVLFLAFGTAYFLVMMLRLAVGLGGLSTHTWFHAYVPTLFHFVLAGFLLVVGHFHYFGASQGQ